jgi:hypothetical protein
VAIDWVLAAKAAAQIIADEKTRKGVLSIIGIVLAAIAAIFIFFFVIIILVVTMLSQVDGYYYPIPEVTTSSGFGPREPIRVYVAGSGWVTTRSFHYGTDFPAPQGTTIYACAGGEVITADSSTNTMAGKHIVIRHEDGTLTKYYHCSEIMVSVGDIVAGFQPIALVGSTGASTGAHLHLELWIEGVNAIDPAEVLQPWPEDMLAIHARTAGLIFVQLDLLQNQRE